jgi:hypothetical protein
MSDGPSDCARAQEQKCGPPIRPKTLERRVSDLEDEVKRLHRIIDRLDKNTTPKPASPWKMPKIRKSKREDFMTKSVNTIVRKA